MASFGDFNRVNTNVTALSAQLSLNKINNELGDSRLKLSTGKRINSAEDNSAGYAIATKLNSRVKGLEQALQNVSDAKSMLDVVEGAYNSIMDNLIEMRKLGLQAANDTISRSERTLIAQQIHGHGVNVNDIANSTHFNGIALNPTTDTNLSFQVGEGTSDTKTIIFRQVDITGLFGPADFQLGGTQNHIDIEFNITQLSHIDDDNDDRGEIAYDLTGDKQVKADAGDFKVYSGKVSDAIDKLNGYLNEVGINQRSLSSKEENLSQAIRANNAAYSRIMDTDFAKEQSSAIRLQILQQTATAALSQANMGPQAVLGFLG